MADHPFTGTLSVTDKVGIGTENPIAHLHISSLTTAPSQTFLESGGALLKLSVDASGAKLGTDNAFSLSIITDGSPRIAIDAVGNIGIGVPTPSTELEVNGTIKATEFQGNGVTLDGIVKKSGDTMTGALTVSGNVQATLFLGNGATLDGIVKKTGDTMTGSLTVQNNLTVSGNVGIGTVSPSQKLEVVGNALVNGSFSINEGTQSTFGGHLYLSKTDGSPGRGQWHINIAPNNALNFVESGIADYRLAIKPGGNVGIGTANPNLRLDVSGDWIGSSDNSQSLGGWRLGRWPANQPNEWVYLSRTDSTAYQDLAVKALWAGGDLRFGSADDLAEMTPVQAEDHLEPGDVVVIDNPPDNRVLLAKSSQPYDSRVAGVIADPTTSGLIIGGSHPTDVNRDDLKPLALAGRVLTKVILENGPINAGDYLTTSSTPGHAMKASSPGSILGKALQSFQSEPKEGINKIWVLINLG
jgi:hypothetical protein